MGILAEVRVLVLSQEELLCFSVQVIAELSAAVFSEEMSLHGSVVVIV